MNSLPELQQRFQTAILGGEPTPGLFAEETPTREGGFAIYLQAYRARLTAALRDNFPVLARALGDDAFADMADAYIDRQPSHFRSIRWFGGTLADFLAAAPEHLPHPALLDLARMDWAMRSAFDAADAELLTFDEVAALRPEHWLGLSFRLIPSVRLVDLRWRIEPTWKALNADSAADSEEPEELPHTLLVWRRDLDCYWRSADACEARVLHALTRLASFADCCLLIAESGDQQAARTAAAFVQRWIAEGLLARD
ncbi:MAG TPA: DNA-binding domain-containing protein [Accumulibacter sp.]|uniref:HvfC/BufC N-terminal domain-containing protein n=1 Tax=Accumulibacter sp. TaxID=2053492 RepID=UPI0025FA89A3|nr:DNA-binding domain-containing protein [Accumulibacter sp.]MCM8598123.1 DNA-binding domain-containing protein [Accumulibacter sp.]MCM8662290.1 DNA-binding domain-containing protein [Accumulibacter sp.]HNC52463.1 DNA-binding domain-containing protein [Accumulibacter sp.]